MALTDAQERFAVDVARRTGLQIPTVRSWVAIENGPGDNPLNIRSSDGTFRGFGSTERAVEATVRLLNTDTYAPVLRIARDPQKTIRDEVWAIIRSPWKEHHYTLNRVVGARLVGAYATLYPARTRSTTPPPATLEPTQADLDAIAKDILEGRIDPSTLPPGSVSGGLADEVKGALGGWVGDLAAWLGEKAALAFLYVVLTLAAVAVIVLGLMRATGTSRAAFARPAGGDIPY